MCRTRLGVVHRHNIVLSLFAHEVFRAGGLGTLLETLLLISSLNLRPTGILTHPAVLPLCKSPDKPTAYNVTIRNPYTNRAPNRAGSRMGGAKTLQDAKKRTIL